MIEVRCNGRIVKGFSSVNITKALDNISASYSMGVFKDTTENAWIPVFPGDDVEVLIDGEVVINGVNIETNPSFNNSGIVCQISGKERTFDLVECSAKTLNFENKKVDEIVRATCADFGIRFVGTNGADIGSPMQSFSADIGSTAFNVIVNACKERGVFPASDGLGNVSLIGSRHEGAEVDIVQGVNVLSASGRFSVQGMFGKYTIYSSKDAKGKTFSSVIDDGQPSRRELVILDERFGNKENCEARALWESRHRQAMGSSLSVIVDGWRQKEGGSLWKPGLVVNCDIPMILGESRSFLVNRVSYTYGSSGTQTALELVDEDIYLPMPTLAPKGKVKKAKGDAWASVRKQTGSKLR